MASIDSVECPVGQYFAYRTFYFAVRWIFFIDGKNK
jgi:hypothetical protein